MAGKGGRAGPSSGISHTNSVIFSRNGMNDVMPPQFVHIGGPRLREVGMDRSMRRERVIGVVQRSPDLALERV